MKLHELILQESSITLPAVRGFYDILDKDGKPLIGIINVIKHVDLYDKHLLEFPVKFGEVGGWFNCGMNKLKTLKGAPIKVGADFDCSSNLSLSSLDNAPQEIEGDFYANRLPNLTSLKGIHKIKKINGSILLNDSFNIKTGGIGLILIEGLRGIDSELPAFEIIRKYLGQGKKGLLACQEELIEAGYEEYAEL